MTQAISSRFALLTSLTLLFCSSIVDAQDIVTMIVENQSLPVNESESIANSTWVMPVEKNVDKLNPANEKSSSAVQQARPGERVSHPEHLILNSDTTLGGYEVNGTRPIDVGYAGPGDMRTHLWNGHSNELIANGITEHTLMAMTVAEVQKWHNYFHGVEGSPGDSHHDGDRSYSHSNVRQPTMHASATYADDPFHRTSVHENFGYGNSGYLQSMGGEPGIIHQQNAITEAYTGFEFDPQAQPIILNQGVVESWPIGR